MASSGPRLESCWGCDDGGELSPGDKWDVPALYITLQPGAVWRFKPLNHTSLPRQPEQNGVLGIGTGMGDAQPAERAARPTFRYKSLKRHFVLFAWVASCGTMRCTCARRLSSCRMNPTLRVPGGRVGTNTHASLTLIYNGLSLNASFPRFLSGTKRDVRMQERLRILRPTAEIARFQP